MATPVDKRARLGDLKRHPVVLAGLFVKCLACVLLLVLLLVIGVQVPDAPSDMGRLLAGSFQHGLPYTFYVK